LSIRACSIGTTLAHRPFGEHHAARSGSPGAAGNFNNSLAIATTGVVGYVVIGPS
jgi:hypothetical protein